MRPIPFRLSAGALDEPLVVDQQMRGLARRLGLQYISPCDIFRNADGYLVRLGDTPDSLVAFDYGHLTVAGSVYLVSHFPTLR